MAQSSLEDLVHKVAVALIIGALSWVVAQVVINTRRLDRVEVQQDEQDRRIREIQDSRRIPYP